MQNETTDRVSMVCCLPGLLFSLPFQISVFSPVSILIIVGTLTEVNAAYAFVSSFTSGFAGHPENIR